MKRSRSPEMDSFSTFFDSILVMILGLRFVEALSASGKGCRECVLNRSLNYVGTYWIAGSVSSAPSEPPTPFPATLRQAGYCKASLDDQFERITRLQNAFVSPVAVI